MMKEKEFQWKKLPKKEYLYFLWARTLSLIYDLFFGYYSLVNLIYFSIKDNGDINAITLYLKEQIKEKPVIIERSFWKFAYLTNKLILKDFTKSTMGYCYIMNQKDDNYILYRVKLNKLKYKDEILNELELYRKLGKSKSNLYFNKELVKFKI